MSAGPLSSWFTGWTVEIDSDDFQFPALLVGSMADIDDSAESYELPDPDIAWKDTTIKQSRLPGAEEEGAWSGLTLTLGTLCKILGGERKSLQLNTWGRDDKGREHGIVQRRYTFQFVPGDIGFQGRDRL